MSTTTSTILVAEENDATRAFLHDNLTADGYRVMIAPDRAKALALLSTADPDLIVVDVNGQTLALLDAIRSGDGLAGRVDPDTPLIVLSRDADRLQRIRVLERGGDDVVKSRSPTQSYAPGSRRCYGARRTAAAAVGSASGRSSSTSCPARHGCTVSRWRCRTRSSRSCARSPPTRRAC